MNNLYTNLTFADVWDEADKFVDEYEASGLAPSTTRITRNSAIVLFYLLYAEYGNSAIANDDENQFKYRVFSTILKYGPTWEKRLDIQSKLRALTDDEIKVGSKTIFNNALNPQIAPSTDTTNEITTINSQNVNKHVRGKLEGYGTLLNLLDTDVTGEFIVKFKPLFMKIGFNSPTIYVTELED